MAERAILLVDDEQEVVEAMTRTLQRQGYRLLHATSGMQALSILAAQTVDVVLSDIGMPEMNGLELLARVRRLHPRVGRIIVTGAASVAAALRAINESEVHRFLTKPWDPEELRAAIRETIQPPDPTAAIPPSGDHLAPRLRQTLAELMTGAPIRVIADRLGISVHTVRQYVKALYRLFEVGSHPELMAKMQGAAASLDASRAGP